VSKDLFPQTIAAIKTKAFYLGIKVIVDDPFTYDFE